VGDGFGGSDGLVLELEWGRRADLAFDDLEDVSDPVGGVAPGVVADCCGGPGETDRGRDVASVEGAGLGGTASQGEGGKRAGGQVGGG
jgi:hypothetical protein